MSSGLCITPRQGRELCSEVLCGQLAPYGAVVHSPGRQAWVCGRLFGQPQRGGRIVRHERSYGALEGVGDLSQGLPLRAWPWAMSDRPCRASGKKLRRLPSYARPSVLCASVSLHFLCIQSVGRALPDGKGADVHFFPACTICGEQARRADRR